MKANYACKIERMFCLAVNQTGGVWYAFDCHRTILAEAKTLAKLKAKLSAIVLAEAKPIHEEMALSRAISSSHKASRPLCEFMSSENASEVKRQQDRSKKEWREWEAEIATH